MVIDSLNGFMNAMPGEQHLAMQMHELLSYLNQCGVATILVLAQAGLISANITSPVIKKRSGPHESIRELSFRNGEILVSEPLKILRGVLSGAPTYAREPASSPG